MMTRFILIGGCQDKADLPALSKVVFTGGNSAIRFLICLFARNRSLQNWDTLFAENIAFFKAISPGQKIEFILADEANFPAQVEAADIIFFSGGDSIPLYATIARIGNAWISKIKGKTVIGTSAGTDLLTTYNFDAQQHAIDKGLGLVPVKTIVHYGANDEFNAGIDWANALSCLNEYGENLPVHPLKEGEFTVVEVDDLA